LKILAKFLTKLNFWKPQYIIGSSSGYPLIGSAFAHTFYSKVVGWAKADR
jgi:hypothetical protein